MDDGGALAEACKRELELKQAARIAGGDHVGVERRNELSFTVPQVVGSIGLDKVVDSRGATTNRGLGNFHKLQVRDIREQVSGLHAHALGMLQVAGIVIGDAKFEPMSRAAWCKIGENFADVFAFGGKLLRALCVLGVIPQQVPVPLHIGTTSCRVGDDGVHLGAFERVDRPFCELESRRFFPGVNEERSATRLAPGGHDFATFGSEDAGGRSVNWREKLALDATE